MRLAALAVLVAACGPQFPSPMTAGQMMQFDTGDALVAYLHQPDASATACDLRARGPHITGYRPDVRQALVDGFTDGSVPPALFQQCADAAFKSAPVDLQVVLLDDIVVAYADMVTSSHLADDPPRAARVAVAARLYLDRRVGLDADAKVVAPILDDLRDKLANNRLSPIGAASAREVVATADVERGVWNARPITPAVMDGLAAVGNEMTLERFAARLPQPDLREQAARRVVRVHIALSAFDEVRGNAAAVEDAVVKDGHNRVTLADHPLVRAWYDAATVPVRGVVVRQDVWNQTATLLGVAPERPTVSVLPALTLRRSLWAELQQLSRPVTVCSAKRELDPTPCIDKTDVSVDNPFAYLDKGATFHFRDDIAESDIVPWAVRSEFALPIAIARQPTVTVHWGLAFEAPAPLDIAGTAAGTRGPDLDVRVTRPTANRYLFAVNGRSAVVEAADLGRFYVASRGASGFSGANGTDGTDGSSGSECSDGGPGGNGGNGDDGGPGGDGGDVRLTIACGTGPCDVATIERIVLSAGGAGGSGGAGGRGGSGGSGGSGRSPTTHTDSNGNTVTDDPGCSAGSSGPSGSSGSSGSDGVPGNAGHVSVVIEH